MPKEKKKARPFRRKGWEESSHTRTFSSSSTKLVEQILETVKEENPALADKLPPVEPSLTRVAALKKGSLATKPNPPPPPKPKKTPT